jgi:hypothetical protein
MDGPRRIVPPPIPTQPPAVSRAARWRKRMRYKWEFIREEAGIWKRILPTGILIFLYFAWRVWRLSFLMSHRY